MTKGVWAEIACGGYVAQAFASSGQRMLEIDGAPTPRKMEVRLYTYNGRVLLPAVRLYPDYKFSDPRRRVFSGVGHINDRASTGIPLSFRQTNPFIESLAMRL